MLVEHSKHDNGTIIMVSHTAEEEKLIKQIGLDKIFPYWVEQPRDRNLGAAIYAKLMQKISGLLKCRLNS
ncbi:hypothetical protein [Candidatus Vallotia lariciata]|uniref:hypothetical protein n=1 Tax=Candidatus Vallotia laricis TaxID=2018052 RepID=UPI001D00C7CD|nr:hypothetical protein [Candidatus Vallotia lariciata]